MDDEEFFDCEEREEKRGSAPVLGEKAEQEEEGRKETMESW
jgi:hypothetical protein